MRLLLLRHGIAEDPDPAVTPDEARELTDEGRDKMAAAARGIATLKLDVTEVLTSPLIRCRQTAAIVTRALHLPDPTQDRRLAPGAGLAEVAEIVAERPWADALILCGHEPDMSGITAELTGADAEVKKGTLVVIEAGSLRPRGGTLQALYPPAALRKLG